MYRFRKVQFYLIFSISIFTSNIAYSGLFDDLTRSASEILKTLKTPADRVDDERSQSIDSSRNPLIEVQDLLNQLGYDAGPANGRFGEKTALAIEAFKRDNNMHVDAQITESLIIALRNANNPDRVGHGSSSTVQFDTLRTMPGGTSFDSAPEPDYLTLFKMYMAANGDLLDIEEFSLKYHVLFNNIETNSEEWEQIRNALGNEFTKLGFYAKIRPPFTQALIDARSWPKKKIFRLMMKANSHKEGFGKYDDEKRMFYLDSSHLKDRLLWASIYLYKNQQGQYLGKLTLVPRTFSLAISGGEKIRNLPMEPAQAKAFLQSRPVKFGEIQRFVDIEMLVEAGPVPFVAKGGYGGNFEIPARVIAARLLDTEDGRVLHTYNTSLFEPAVAEATLAGSDDDAVPPTALSGTLLVLRDHPQLIEDDWALEFVKNQIVSEQGLWKDIDKTLPEPRAYKNFNYFTYEWQTLVKEQPNLANGPVLDVFWQPDPDLSFVKQEKEWDDRLEAIVSVFLFSRDKIEGRDPEFIARELLPVWKRHFEAILAKKKTPERMRVSRLFPELNYDHNTQSLQLVKGKNLVDLFAPIVNVVYEVPPVKERSSGGNIVLPQSARKSGLYRLDYEYPIEYPITKNTLPGSIVNRTPNPDWKLLMTHPQLFGRRSLMLYAQVLALDRRLELTSIPVATSEAEALLRKIGLARQKNNGRYSIEARLIFEPVRTELGTLAHRNGTTQPYPILFGRVIRVDLLMADGQLITSFGPDDFPSAKVHAAAVAKEEAEERHKIADAQRKIADSQRKQEDMFEKCAAMTTAEERLQCLKNLKESGFLKDSLQNKFRLKGAIQEAKNQMRGKGMKGIVEEMKAQTYMSMKLWAPRRGTAEYEAALAACIKVPKREAYGPDIVGLRLGMEKNEAQDIVRKQIKSYNYVMLNNKKTRPFEDGTLSYTDDASRGIALFSIMNHGEYLVAAVSRRVYFGDNGPTSDQIIEGLRKKYGTETWSDGKKTMVWAFPTGSEHLSTKKYSGLVELIVPRDNWDGSWAPQLTHQERIQAMQKKQEEADYRAKAYEKCIMEAAMKAQPYERNYTKYMKIFNKEMEICEEKYGYVAQTQNTEETKLPLMIGPEGSPEIYAKYKKCGPVVIVLLNTDAEGMVMDASFVLFDPSWIAEQPAFAFKSKKSDSKVMIDF